MDTGAPADLFPGTALDAGADPLAAAHEEQRTAFVVEQHITLLDRIPGAIEVSDWASALRGGLTGAAMRQAIMESREYIDHLRLVGQRREVLATGLFDAAWYLAAYQDVAAAGLDPLSHFCGHGRAEGRAPNAYLIPAWYRQAYAVSDDVDAMSHYLEIGEPQGWAGGEDFDPAWYRAAYRVPDGVSPLAHFLANRSDDVVGPCARLWSARWLPPAADAPPGLDPFAAFSASNRQADWLATPDIALIRAAGVFDENYYALHSADVLEAGIDPLEHFCRFGWREGRDPNFYFKTRWYASTNPEVTRLAVNPLSHYLMIGEPAGRRPVVFFDPVWYRRAYAVDPDQSCLAHFLANRRSQTVSPHPLFDPAFYMARCGTTLHPRRDPFSHFLIAGMQSDVPPSAGFDPAAWRKQTRGRQSRHFRNLLSPERDNPLINYLLSTYR